MCVAFILCFSFVFEVILAYDQLLLFPWAWNITCCQNVLCRKILVSHRKKNYGRYRDFAHLHLYNMRQIPVLTLIGQACLPTYQLRI